jgi:hypothetical protein
LDLPFSVVVVEKMGFADVLDLGFEEFISSFELLD